MTSRNVPRLRFKGFGDEWKKGKLLNLYEDGVGGGTPKTSIESYWDGNIPWFQSSDLDEGTVSIKKVHKYITSKAIEQTSAKLIPANSIAIVTRVGVGKVALIPYKYATSQDFNSLSKLNVDPKFGVYYVYKLMNVLKNRLQGTSIKGITKSDLNNSKIIISDSIHEQQHIGNFFSKLDYLIDLHSQKLEQLKKLKRGHLQKMFPQEGETLPRLRFHGFSDKWISHKFGDYLSIPKKEAIEVNDINQLMTLKLNLKGVYRGSTSSTLKLGSTKYYKRHKGQLIYGKQNFFHGSIAIIPDELDGLATSSDVPSFNIDGMDRDYLYYYISRKDFYERAEKYTTGTGSKRLHENDFLELSFMVPSLEEQRKISGFFNSIDNFIEIEKNKLDELKKQKKAYLQKMFI